MLYSIWWELIGKFIIIEIKEGVVTRAYLSDIADGSLSPHDQKDWEVIERINKYISGEKFSLNDIQVDLNGLTIFQRQVLEEMRKIPPGKTVPYSTLAVSTGSPNAVRAVGSVCARNPIFLIIPCHRVIRKDGLGGFGYGTAIKERILQHELKYFATKQLI
jgi:O-6-methylguanine DNA methyltransferase